MNSFSDFGLLSSLLKTLKTLRLTKPTEVQMNTIPLMMGGQSVVGVAETGSGKTLAYALPMLHKIKTLEDEGSRVEDEARPRAIVMVPTRELGEQVSKVLKTLTHDTRLRVRPALGGMAMEQAKRNTAGPFEILLATPGRLTQLMQAEKIDLSDVRMLIFDEADQMMDSGFLPDSQAIFVQCPKDVQPILFSATVSPTVQELINRLFFSAEVFRSSGSGKVVSTLVTKNMNVIDGQRWPIFEKILKQPHEGGTIVFANTREQCDKIAEELKAKNYDCVVYRGEMDKNERRSNLKQFRDGKIPLLIATDLAGRGLDLEHVDRIINYHLPKQMDNYLHRVGRTARAGKKGLVINLVTERDEFLIAKLEGRKPVGRRPRNKGEEKAEAPKKTVPRFAKKAAAKPARKQKPRVKAKSEVDEPKKQPKPQRSIYFDRKKNSRR